VRHLPQLHVDVDAINSRLADLATTKKCKKCKIPVTRTAADIANLLIQVTSLYQALIQARLEAANLRAAIYAALGAAEDGDPDPLGYLKDEIAEYLDERWSA
jgi:hypothetical protein